MRRAPLLLLLLAAETGAQTTADAPSMVSLAAGAFPIKSPAEFYGHSVLEMMDGRFKSAWRSASRTPGPHVFLLVLAQRTELATVGFDCNYDLFQHDNACAKDVRVEVSDVSESDGFQKIAEVTLRSLADKQEFPVSKVAPARWVRLTILSNYGDKEVTQLNEFRATGKELTGAPAQDVTGVYRASTYDVNLRQEGTSVSGCYTYLGRSDNTIQGGIEGRLVKFSYCRYCSTAERIRGTGVMTFRPDGAKFLGLTWAESGALNDYGGEQWAGEKKGKVPEKCGQTALSAEDGLTAEIEQFGRARVYGINFDVDSDRIKDESKTTLEKIANILRKKPDWKIAIEGHTDSTATPQHNQTLSEKRAASVKRYLESVKIDGKRLTTVGYGATKPVADNSTELGRAQNRRVELAKQP